MKSGCLTKGCPNPSLQSIEMLPNKEVQLAPISNMVDFAESNEIANLFKDYQWQAKHSDGELILSKMFGCLILKLQLSFEFISENIQHFVVEDIEVETRKGKRKNFGIERGNCVSLIVMNCFYRY